MSDDLDKRLLVLRQKAAQARQQREQAERGHAVAVARAEEAREALSAQFGVSGVAEATELEARLTRELDEEISKAEALLGEAAK